MKKIVLIIICLLLITGCNNNSKDKVKICTRTGELTNGSASMEYTVTYSNDYIKTLKAVEKVTSEDSSILDQYEESYKKIYSYYEGLEYYDTKVTRTSNSVISNININYEKIDIDKLLSIEGKEDNIIVNGKASLSSWLKLAKKVGVTCKNN